MESTGFHLQHQLQEEFAHQYSASSATKSDYKPSFYQACNKTRTFNLPNRFLTESITRELEPKCSVIDSLVRTSTSQDFGFYDGKNFTQQLLASDVLDDNSPKLSNMINIPSRVVNGFHSLTEPHQYHSFLSGCHVTAKELLPAQASYSPQNPLNEGINVLCETRRYDFGSVPSSNTNLSTLDLPTSLVSCSLGLNSQMLDLHTSYGGGNQLSYDAFRPNEESMRLSHSNMQVHENSSSISNKISAFMNGVERPKRSGNCFQQKESSEAKAKKSRTSSCPPPLKVRKEKLGDRIQTLQRLVAPFGKTDTASVLTEAIGYIHFLHDQIQTLSVPYLKLSQSRGKTSRILQLDPKEDAKELNTDLRSRGLCLVPLSYASCVHWYI